MEISKNDKEKNKGLGGERAEQQTSAVTFTTLSDVIVLHAQFGQSSEMYLCTEHGQFIKTHQSAPN